MKLMKAINFFREGIKNLKTVGTVTRSSRFLCQKAIEPIDFSRADAVVELGAGDGVITHHILNEMKPDARLLAFEVNESFCENLHQIEDARLVVANESAELIGRWLRDMGADKADYVVSAIPFVALPRSLSKKMVSEVKKHLKPGGLFIQVHYSLLMKPLYEEIFGNVDVNFVPLNVPPAFVLVSENR